MHVNVGRTRIHVRVVNTGRKHDYSPLRPECELQTRLRPVYQKRRTDAVGLYLHRHVYCGCILQLAEVLLRLINTSLNYNCNPHP